MAEDTMSPLRSVLVATIFWTSSIVAIHVMLTRVFAVGTDFATVLVAFTIVVTLPAGVIGLTMGIRKAQAHVEDAPRVRGARIHWKQLLVIASGFALTSLLILGGIYAMTLEAFIAATGLLVIAAAVSWVSLRRLQRLF